MGLRRQGQLPELCWAVLPTLLLSSPSSQEVLTALWSTARETKAPCSSWQKPAAPAHSSSSDPAPSQAALQTPGTAGDTAGTLSVAPQPLDQPQISSPWILRQDKTHRATANLLVGDEDLTALVLHGLKPLVELHRGQVHDARTGLGAQHGVGFPNS